MELEVYTTNVELQDIPSYTTSITLEGQLLRLSFLWNERIGKRTLHITDSADQCYLQNTILHPNEPFELNANAVLNDLPYSVTLIKTGDQKRVGNIFNWSKDFILCFSRTVDVEVEKLNVVYGVTTPSTPTLPKPYGSWILNQGYEIVGNDIKYTGYKTNGLNYYDGFALADLVQALVKSFHDPDLQQYTAFTTAVEQLIGSVDWILDSDNNRIKYYEEPSGDSSYQYGYKNSETNTIVFTESQAQSSAQAFFDRVDPNNRTVDNCNFNSNKSAIQCEWWWKSNPNDKRSIPFSRVVNPAYDPDAEREEKYLPLDVVAQQVISNAASSADEVLRLLSEDFINLVANSVFDNNPSKQFVKLEDLIPQLEVNKVLR